MKAEISNTNASIGAERFKADVRCFGGLLLVLGAMATINPLANVAGAITLACYLPRVSLFGR
jgi:hypothetical protein